MQNLIPVTILLLENMRFFDLKKKRVHKGAEKFPFTYISNVFSNRFDINEYFL